MKATELRIGNYVYDNLGGILKIKGVNTESDLSHIKPIPLTEKWLMDFGFEKETKSYFTLISKTNENKSNFSFVYSKDLNGDWYILIDESIKVFIHFVHEWQNLCFDLTGQELTLNEKQS